MTQNRLDGADFVRASACMIVLFHHLAQRVDWRQGVGPLDFTYVFVQTGGFGVAMFFVLSGFLLARPFWSALDAGRDLPDLRTYAMRRAARILPGFWLALTVSFALSVAVFGFRLDGWLAARFVAGLALVSNWHWTSLFPVEVNGPLWSIGFEVSAYAMLPAGFVALFALGRGRGRLRGWLSRVLWLIVIGAALGLHWLFVNLVPVDRSLAGWEYGLQGGAKTWMPRYNGFSFFAMFAVGALAGGVQVMLARHRHVLFDALSILALAAVGWLLWQQSEASGTEGWGFLGVPHGFPLFQLAVGMVLVVTPSSVLAGRVLDNPLTRYVAQISFGIYVWHYVVLELVRLSWVPEMDHDAMRDPALYAAASGLVIGLSVAVAALSYRYVEAPVMAWARRREPGGRTPTLSPAAG